MIRGDPTSLSSHPLELVLDETFTFASETGFSSRNRTPVAFGIWASGRRFIDQNKTSALALCANVFHLYFSFDAIGTFPHLLGPPFV